MTAGGEGMMTSRPRSIPHSERLCKVLPKVMETAIRGVKDLDEQVTDAVVVAIFVVRVVGLDVQLVLLE